MKILILGGTAEARHLAAALVALNHDVTTALAGRTVAPLQVSGQLRTGGFGGVQGLATYIAAENFERVIDATHPYAEQISRHAALASQHTSRPLLRLLRPGWEEQPGADWQRVADMTAAAMALPKGAIVLLTTGHRGLEAFSKREDCRFIVRLIEAPTTVLASNMHLVLSRPPYSIDDETRLMQSEQITHLVSKNSGGVQTMAKLAAAQALGVGIIMINRPDYDYGTAAASVDNALGLL
ncbi:cobalt-precorrin-6A reductase [Devosia algicola]|uniref:Cobalt-precorrin-6A reductase n=1 Tax=Devosia algicola TaxID=3026418 RepID=A0ABY7YMQ3_9HYPH|nr:cobalt-precorrin-6A reductase [Devosia algicola]WDR02477.1 cobalt-precorrin-6A reductase [Devosia algicola]